MDASTIIATVRQKFEWLGPAIRVDRFVKLGHIEVGGWVPRVRRRTRAGRPTAARTASPTNPWHPGEIRW